LLKRLVGRGGQGRAVKNKRGEKGGRAKPCLRAKRPENLRPTSPRSRSPSRKKRRTHWELRREKSREKKKLRPDLRYNQKEVCRRGKALFFSIRMICCPEMPNGWKKKRESSKTGEKAYWESLDRKRSKRA